MSKRTVRIDITATGVNAELRVNVEDEGRSMGTFNLSARQAEEFANALLASVKEAVKAPDGVVVDLGV